MPRVIGLLLPSILLTLMVAPAFGAASQTFAGTGTGNLFIDYGGSYGEIGKFNADTAQLTVKVTIDSVGLNLGYDQFTIFSDGFDLSFNQLFTVGLGQSVPIKTDIHVNAFTLTALNNTPYKMVPTTGGKFDLMDNGANFFPFPNFLLTGNYAIR